MDVPDGGKFVFFIVPVFAVSLLLIFVFITKRDEGTIGVDDFEDIENDEDIFLPEDDRDEVLDFDEFKVETTEEGVGKEEAEAGDEVSVHYILSLRNGETLQSSYDIGDPYTFVLGIGAVIQGWDQGIVGMKEGEKRRLEIPSELGYGPEGNGQIPGGAGLIFETELVSIN